MIAPPKPASHVQSPAGTFVPDEFGGQATAEQLPEKNGLAGVAAIVPLKPASQVHPHPTLVPPEFEGQLTGEECTEQQPEKNGLAEVAAIVPLKPASQVQPEPTLVPVEFEGQLVATQLPEKNGAGVWNSYALYM